MGQSYIAHYSWMETALILHADIMQLTFIMYVLMQWMYQKGTLLFTLAMHFQVITICLAYIATLVTHLVVWKSEFVYDLELQG